MTNFNFFSLNIGFNLGMNNLFSPMSSCLGNFANLNMCSLFTNPFEKSTPIKFDFSDVWKNTSFNNTNNNGSDIFSGCNFGSIWDNAGFNSGWNNGFSWNDQFIRTSGTSGTSDDISAASADYKPISLDGYNAENGKKLAKAIWEGRNKTKVFRKTKRHPNGTWTDFTGDCAKKVREALQKTGLFNNMTGHAFQYLNILRKNSNFKEIAVSGDNYKHLPAGCILVYDKGVAGYDSDYGHIEVIAENGKGVSDGVTNNIRKPSAIFMPV